MNMRHEVLVLIARCMAPLVNDREYGLMMTYEAMSDAWSDGTMTPEARMEMEDVWETVKQLEDSDMHKAMKAQHVIAKGDQYASFAWRD